MVVINRSTVFHTQKSPTFRSESLIIDTKAEVGAFMWAHAQCVNECVHACHLIRSHTHTKRINIYIYIHDTHRIS